MVVVLFALLSCKDDKEDAKPKPTADFSFDNSKGRTIAFTNASKNATTYFFDFGDGTAFSSELNPSHTYAKDSTYNVTLTAIGDGGLSVKTLQVQVTGIVGPNLLKGGDLEAGDEAKWTKIFSGQKYADGTFAHVNYKFGATDNKPAAANGGFFNVSNGSEGPDDEVGTIFYQELSLTKGVYKFSANIKYPSVASGLKLFWFETYLGKAKPVFNDPEDPNNKNGYNYNSTALLSGFIHYEWVPGGTDPYTAKDGSMTELLYGFDGNTIASKDGILNIKEDGTYYFVFKTGKGKPKNGAGYGTGGISVDNLFLGKFQ
jgi:PKD repeat protein